MKLNALNSWEIIDKTDYLKFGIVETTFMKCEGAYLKNYKGQNITITLYNYGIAEEDAFDEIEKSIIKNENENNLVDNNTNEDTSIISCIFSDRLVVKGYECFAMVSKILLPEGTYSYVFQLYAKSNSNLYSVQFKFASFDETNIEKSLSEDETFNEILNAIN